MEFSDYFQEDNFFFSLCFCICRLRSFRGLVLTFKVVFMYQTLDYFILGMVASF